MKIVFRIPSQQLPGPVVIGINSNDISGPAGSYQATLIHSNAHGGQPTIVSPASTNPNLLNVANNVPRPTNSASPAPLTSAQPLASSFPTDLRFSQNVGPLGYSQSPFKLSNVANNPRVLMNSAIGSSTVAQLPSYRSNDLPGRVSAMQASVNGPWVWSGLAISTASTSGDAITACGSVSTRPPPA